MIKYAYPLLFLLLLFYCKPADLGTSPGKAKFGETFILKKDVPLKVTGIGEALVLKLDVVNDSRCPANAICVSLGSATVLLTASNSSEQLEQVQMCIGDCRPEPARTKHTMEVQVGNSKYSFTLKGVTPFPGSGKEGEEKAVKLEVNQL